MLKRKYRLGNIHLIKPITVESSLFKIRTSENGLSINRFSIIVSKRVDRHSVVRNRIKRKLGASLNEIFDKIKGGRAFLIYPKAAVLEKDKSHITNELLDKFKKLHLLND